MSAVVKKLDEQSHGNDQDMIAAINRSQAVIEFNLDGSVITANENFLKTLGYDLSEIQGKHHSLFCDPEFVETKAYTEFWNKLRQGEFESGEFLRFGKNGKEVWINASYNPILDQNGKPYKVVKFATDITSSKTEIKVLTDIMNVTSIISESNLKGEIIGMNDKYIEISKYSKEELMGRGHNITRHPDMPKEVFKEMWATIGRGKMFRGKIKNLAKDGSVYYVDAVVAPILGENGKPKKYLGVRYDITENEIAQQEMKGVLSAIDSSFAYIEFDTKGNILSNNQIFSDVSGYSSEEIKGKHHRIFCDPDYTRSSAYTDFWKNLENGKRQCDTYKRFNHRGEVIWLQAVYAPVIDEAGNVMKVIKIATDVTEQQNMIFAIQETASALSGASTELTATASEMSRTSEQTSQESIVASAAAEEVSAGVQTVATNIEEMVASIKEIGRSTNESSQMAKTTLERAQESNATVTKLGISSQEIGDVIKVISSIAQQTNLLALNATIEAARAGDAGRGFAVVANEVKELAKQTAKATADITNKIGAIQTDTKSAIEAIAGISISVEKLNGISAVIAAAVEEQTATTNEISRVVVESKKGVESIAETIRHVSMAANESSTSSSQTLEASQELARLADKLSALTKKH